VNFRPKKASRDANRARAGASPAKYYRSKDIAASPFRKNEGQKRRRSWAGRAVDIVILATLIGVAIYSLIVSSTPEVSVNSEAYHSLETYTAATIVQLGQLTNRTKITLNEKQIADALKKQHPEITNVGIELPIIGQKPRVKIEVGLPVLKLDSASHLYVVNDEGVVIGETSRFSGTDALPTVKDESGFEISTGRAVLQSSAVGFIKSLKAQLDKSQIPISSISLPPRAQELDLRTADRPYYVKFFLGGNAATQVGQYLATRQQLDKDGTNPSEYMDVRVQGKAFYK